LVNIRNASPTITSCTFRNSQGAGVWVQGEVSDTASTAQPRIAFSQMLENRQGLALDKARPVLEKNTFASNTEYGLQNNSTLAVDARNSWWGRASGPKHASNSSGTGDAVSDNVLFDPWLQEKPQAPASGPLPAALGDVNKDGRVSVRDAIAILQFAARLQTPSAEQTTAADVNKDGGITAQDALLVLRYTAGLINTFPKLVGTPLALTHVQARIVGAEHQSDAAWLLEVALERPEGIAAGDLLLAYEPSHGRPLNVRVEGLSADALTAVNADVAGAVRLGFVEPAGGPEGQVVLRILLPDMQTAEPPQVDLTGQLYNQLGVPVADVHLLSSALPQGYALQQNYPNPFNPSTTLRYGLREAGHVVLEVYGVTGQRVRQLVDLQLDAGLYLVEWDGRDDHARPVAAGAYLCRLSVEEGRFTAVRRMVLVK
jgi:hypothetical protein